ncbi:MAG TPA: tetratricopeptide repeat protein [Polyangia bacterium]|nr:tetratricopeptide repeat protein [Polyangia bacterium]
MRASLALIGAAVLIAAGAARAGAPAKHVRVSGFRAALPDGLTLVLSYWRLDVERGKLRAPIEVRADSGLTSFEVRLGPADGSVVATITDNCDERHVVNLTIAGLEARLENAAALALHRQRRWSESAAGFARALARDPTFDVAATNLASAQVMAGKADDAVKTIAPLLARKPVAAYARLVSDPELTPLLGRPEVATLRTPAPGTARLTMTATSVDINGFAVSSRYRVVAAVHSESSWGVCASTGELVLLDLQGGEVARLPLYSTTADEEHDCPIAKSERPRVAARVAAAQRLLTDLGFSPAGERGQVDTEFASTRARFPRAKIGLVIGQQRVRALRGNRELGAAPVRGEHIEAATFLDGYDAIVFEWEREGREGCQGTDPRGIQVLPIKIP